MNSNNQKSNTIKAVNMMIIGMVAAGSLIFVVLNQASSGRELISTLFLAFLGAIITVQVIPGVVLLGAMLKGVIKLVRKQVAAEASSSHDAHK